MDKPIKNPTVLRDVCGTTAGYHRHKHYKECFCDGCKKANAEASKKWRKENPDAHKVLARKSYLRHADKRKAETAARRKMLGSEIIAVQNKAWREANAEKVRESKRVDKNIRRTRIMATKHEPYSVKQVLDKWGTDCHICKDPIDFDAPRHSAVKGYERGLHLDHVIPIAKGGNDTLENVKPSHASCNIKKNMY